MTLKILQIYTYLHLLIKRYMENEPGSQGLFCFMLIHISHGIKYQFLKKIYDVINKVYTFKFENLTIFIAFPLPSMETGTKFHVFQSDLAPKRIWWPIFFIA